MCSIVYQPCDIESFRIGPSTDSGVLSSLNEQFQSSNGVQTLNDATSNGNGNGMQQMNPVQMQVLDDDAVNTQAGITTTIFPTSNTAQQAMSVTTTPATTMTTPLATSVAENTSIPILY